MALLFLGTSIASPYKASTIIVSGVKITSSELFYGMLKSFPQTVIIVNDLSREKANELHNELIGYKSFEVILKGENFLELVRK